MNLLASHSILRPKKLMLSVETMKLVGMDLVEYACIVEVEYNKLCDVILIIIRVSIILAVLFMLLRTR